MVTMEGWMKKIWSDETKINYPGLDEHNETWKSTDKGFSNRLINTKGVFELDMTFNSFEKSGMLWLVKFEYGGGANISLPYNGFIKLINIK